MRCKNCGKTLNNQAEAKVCSYCGTKILRHKTDLATYILSAITIILFIVLLYVVYDRFLEDKIKDKFKKDPKPSTTYSDTKKDVGNTPGNLSNGGVIAESKDYIYYTVINKKLDTNLYKKSKTNNEEGIMLIEGKCSNINVMSDAIYYTDANEKLNRMELGGKEQGIIKKIGQEGSYRYVTVVGDWIYFCDSNDKLHKMRPNGNELTALGEGVFKNITVLADRVYGIGTEGKLTHVGTGGEKEKTTDIKCNEILAYSNWLYFTDGTSVYRALSGNLAKEKIADVNASNINIYDNVIYFYNNETKSIYKMDIDGDNITELIEFSVKSIYLVDKNMFILNAEDNLMYQYSLDSSDLPIIAK